MKLSSYGREYYELTITTSPATIPTDWEASFDGGATWITALNVSGNSAWLVRGTNAPAGAAVAIITASLNPKVRLTLSPEIIVRDETPRIGLT